MLVLVSVLGLPAPAAAPPSREITREMRAPSAEICSENDGRPPPVLPVPLAFVFVVFVFVLVTVSGLREGGATDVMILPLTFWSNGEAFVGLTFVWCSATRVLVLLVLEVLELVKLLVRRTSIGSAAARTSTRCSSVGLLMRSRVVMAFLSFILIYSSGFQ